MQTYSNFTTFSHKKTKEEIAYDNWYKNWRDSYRKEVIETFVTLWLCMILIWFTYYLYI